jgi:hypothetical protein
MSVTTVQRQLQVQVHSHYIYILKVFLKESAVPFLHIYTNVHNRKDVLAFDTKNIEAQMQHFILAPSVQVFLFKCQSPPPPPPIYLYVQRWAVRK